MTVPPLPDAEPALGGVAELIGGHATAGRFALVELVVARGAEPPRHIHHWEDEALYVVAGEVDVLVGAERQVVGAGGAVFVPRGVEHGVAVISGPARVLSAFLPAGFDGFYRETAALGAHDLDRWIATAARYGCEITGPALRQSDRGNRRGEPDGGNAAESVVSGSNRHASSGTSTRRATDGPTPPFR